MICHHYWARNYYFPRVAWNWVINLWFVHPQKAGECNFFHPVSRNPWEVIISGPVDYFLVPSIHPRKKLNPACHSLFYPLSKGTPVNLALHLEQLRSTSTSHPVATCVPRLTCHSSCVYTTILSNDGGLAMMHDESYSLFLLHFLGAILYL